MTMASAAEPPAPPAPALRAAAASSLELLSPARPSLYPKAAAGLAGALACACTPCIFYSCVTKQAFAEYHLMDTTEALQTDNASMV